MFQFRGFTTIQHVFNMLGCPIRTSADQGSFAPPRSFSQLTTSFVVSESQGIPHTLLFRFHLFNLFRSALSSVSFRSLLSWLDVILLYFSPLLHFPVLSMNFLHALSHFHSADRLGYDTYTHGSMQRQLQTDSNQIRTPLCPGPPTGLCFPFFYC